MAYSRRLAFFDKTVVTDTESGGTFSDLSSVHPTCSTSGRGFLWLGVSTGVIYRIDCGQQVISFKAHESSVRHLYQLKQHNLLISVGVDSEEQDVGEHVKIWNLAKWQSKQTTPFCCRSSPTVSPGQAYSAVTCLAVDESLQFIVLGHKNGLLQLLRGDITRSRQCKRTILHTFSSPLLGVGLYNPPVVRSGVELGTVALPSSSSSSSNRPNGPLVYAASSHMIMSFLLQPRRPDEIQFKTVLDSFDVPLNCTCMFLDTLGNPRFAAAYKDAIYFYQWDGRGPCLATEGNKLVVGMFKNYLVIVKGCGDQPVASPSNARATTTIAIHDLQNRFIAGEFIVPQLLTVFLNADCIYLLTGLCGRAGDVESGRMLLCLSEKSIAEKLELLFSKKSFQTAIEIAKSQRYTVEQLGSIYAHYADHLYKNKEYDAAVQEYIKTIGTLEASYVIQRFLEGGHILQLTEYLEALTRTSKLATKDHWTLLLTCYSRLQDNIRIDRFVKNHPLPEALDVEAAIHVLRQGGFFSTAMDLASRCKRFSEYVEILMDDLADPKAGLQLIRELPFDEALKAICNHGTVLVEVLPTETLEVLEQLCNHQGSSKINVQHLLKIFINNREGLMHFLERYLKSDCKSLEISGIVDTLLELTVQLAMSTSSSSNPHAQGTNLLREAALRLLRNEKLPYDSTKALLLCHQRHFTEGCILLWEKLEMYDQLLKHYMQAESVDDVLVTCHKFGDAMPRLWLSALDFFAHRPDCPAQLQVVISVIDRQNLASPLSVLQVLGAVGRDQSCSVGTVRDFFLSHLETGGKRIESMRSELQQLRQETMRNREVVRNLSTQMKVFQQVKCQMCHQSLRPPSVHFLCDHSYHKLCFETYTSGDLQCPECAEKNSKILASLAHRTESSTASVLTDTSTETFIRDLEYALREVQQTSSGSGREVQLSDLVTNLIASQPVPASQSDGGVNRTSDMLSPEIKLYPAVAPKVPSGITSPVTTGSPSRSQSLGYFSSSSKPVSGLEPSPEGVPPARKATGKPSTQATPFDDFVDEEQEDGVGSGLASAAGADESVDAGERSRVSLNPFD